MKKLTALMLALMLALAVVPGVALADATVTTAAELTTALATGGTIQLTANIDMSAVSTFTVNKTVTIDMNGFNISGKPTSYTAFTVVEGGNLTLTNTNTTLSRLLVGTGETNEYNYEGIRIKAGGQATVKENVSIETGLPVFIYGNGSAGSAVLNVYGKLAVSACMDSGDAYAAIQGNGSAGKGGTQINIYPGAEVLNPFSMAMYIPQAGVVNISGGTITGKDSAIGLKSGTLNISDGTLRATGPSSVPTSGYSNGINASGCAIQLESNSDYSGNIVVNITGGTIISDNAYALYEYLGKGTETDVNGISITGGSLQSSGNVDGIYLISKELEDKNVVTVADGVFTKGDSSEVIAKADVAYIVVIPSSVNFGTISKSMPVQSRDFKVEVQNALIEDGYRIKVTNTTTGMNMKDKNGTGTNVLPFELAQPNGEFLFAYTDLTSGTKTIMSSISCKPADLTAAGSYKGTMTFAITYEVIPTTP